MTNMSFDGGFTLSRSRIMDILNDKLGGRFRFALSLALVTVLGPVATDMYLPSMPEIAREFDTSYSNVQLSLTVFLAAQGAGQLFFGPIVDSLGRRVPLLLGILFFILSSFGTALSNDISTLVFIRLLQGVSASLTLVVAISKVSDVADGVRAAWLFAVLITIEGLAPVLAPFFGGIIDAHFGWRVVMASFAAMGFIAFANSFFTLSETLPKHRRIPMNLPLVFKNYLRIGLDRKFLLPAMSVSMAFFFLFAYAGGASYVYQNYFGLSSDSFGMFFGATGLAVLFGACASAKFVARLGTKFLSLAGAFLILMGAGVAIVLMWANASFFGVVLGMFICMLGLGVAEANLVAIAMSSQKTALGSTAALLGSMKLIMASLSTPIAGIFAEIGTLCWLVFLMCSALSAFVLTAATVIFAEENAGEKDVIRESEPLTSDMV